MILPVYNSPTLGPGNPQPPYGFAMPPTDPTSNFPSLQPMNATGVDLSPSYYGQPMYQAGTYGYQPVLQNPATAQTSMFSGGAGVQLPSPLEQTAVPSGQNMPVGAVSASSTSNQPARTSTTQPAQTPAQAVTTAPNVASQNALPVPGSISQGTTGGTTTNVTSAVLQNPALLSSGQITTASPTMNMRFAPLAPPPVTALPKGQEAAVPGSLYTPLGSPNTGQFLQYQPTPTPGAPGSPTTQAAIQVGVSTSQPGQYPSLDNVVANAMANVQMPWLQKYGSSIGGGLMLAGGLLSKLGGMGSTIGGAVGGALTKLGAFAGPAAPFVIGAGAVLDLVSQLFHGADPLQVPASKVEQTFEATADNVMQMAKGGYLSKDQAQSIMDQLVQVGNNYYTGMASQLGKAGAKGTQNMDTVIGDEIKALNALPDNIPQQAFNPQAVSQLVVQPGTQGWYSDSLDASLNLTNQLTQVLFDQSLPGTTPAQQPTPTTTTPQGLPGLMPLGGQGLPGELNYGMQPAF